MKRLTVYRVDRENRTKTPIGTVVERRKGERGSNLVGLLRTAREIFIASPGEQLQVQADNLWIDF